MQLIEVQDLRVPSKRVAMVSRKVFWGASNPFITGIFPAWCEILHQSLSRRMVREESAKKGEGERDDGRGGGPGAVMGPLERRGRMEGAKDGSSRRGSGRSSPESARGARPAPPGSAGRRLPLPPPPPPPPPAPRTPTVPPRAAEPARSRRAARSPGKNPRWPGAPQPDLRLWGRGGRRSRLGEARNRGACPSPRGAGKREQARLPPPGSR